jgi:parallel beta-helix repeat protein
LFFFIGNRGKTLNKNILSIGITFLLIITVITPITLGYDFKSGNQVSGDIIIVDDEGDGDYSSIKEALNHADPRDTIEVYSGTYYEYGIIISEDNITLKGIPYELGNGSDTGKPFINGQGKDFVIGYNMTVGVVITNFHIENGGGTYAHDIIHIYRSDKCEFSNNDVFNTNFALIYCRGSTNIQIKNNNISHSIIDDGISFVDGSNYNTISDNIISDVEIGIDLWDSNHHTITGNKISRCRDFGIDIAGSNYNTIKGNSFEDNAIGVHIIYHSRCSRIKNNNFINNHLQAYCAYGFPIFYDLTNRWNGNYWNESHSLPYPIRGARIFFPWVQFDWFPAKEPYDIEEGVI